VRNKIILFHIITALVVNRFCIKLFETNNRDTASYCRMQSNFELPNALAQTGSKDFVVKYRSCDNIFCKYV